MQCVGETPCPQIGEKEKLSVTCFLFMQAYFAIAEGLKQNATLKAAPGKAPEELMNDIDPRMIEALHSETEVEGMRCGGSLGGTACKHSVLRRSSGAEAAR